MLATLLAPRFIVLYVFVASAVYVHYRGRVRHGFLRQLTDHSSLMAPYNALMYLFSAVPNRPYVDVARFPELAPLCENWCTIREEALGLFDEGRIRAVNAAMFALLPPGSRLGAHRDPFAGSLRYHLGLVTPNADTCRIVVDGEAYSWRDGEPVMFDETFIHTAENRSDVTRIILFCDIERPLRTSVVRAVNHFVKMTVIRASQTENAPGDRVGVLNHIFNAAYRVRLIGKAIKKRSRVAHYTLKWLLLGGILYLIFR